MNEEVCRAEVEPKQRMIDKLRETTDALRKINNQINLLSMYLRGCVTNGEPDDMDPDCVAESVEANLIYAQKALYDITEIIDRI